LSDSADVTFNDVYAPLLSSQYPANTEYHTLHNSMNTDEWRLKLSVENVTNCGMTINFEQFGGEVKGELQTGSWFKIEKIVEDDWQELSTNPLIDYAWDDVAYEIKKNDITALNVEWKWLYGELEPGYYRLSKEVTNFTKNGNSDEKIYQVYFNIK